MITITNLHKSYADNKILNGINLDVKKNEVLALLGQSGSGKSTLLKCINQLEQFEQGSILLNQTNYEASKKYSAKQLQQLRTKVGLVFQHFNLWNHMTVLKNLTLAPKKVLKMNKAEAEEKALDILTRFNLVDKKDAYPNELSGGQKQRVSIARSLMMNPDILLFDEPTSALDPEMVHEVLALIKELKNLDITMIISTHEIEFAKSIADKVAFIEKGSVHEFGGAEILEQPQTERLQQFLSLMNTI